MVHLGVDLGSKRIGLAVSDAGGEWAFPLMVLEAKGRSADVQAVAGQARQAGAGCVVIGLPMNMDGTEGLMAKNARRFSERLEQALAGTATVRLSDERLTSFAADRASGTGNARAAGPNDARAAAILLQQYLDEHGKDQAGG